MKHCIRIALAAVYCLSPLAAQEDTAPGLGRLQRSLQQKKNDVDRLLDLRLRHDLGLPVPESGALFEAGAPVTTESLERARRDLQNEDIATSSLLQRFERLKGQVAQLKAEAAAQAERTQQQSEWVTVPRPGAVQARPQGMTPPPSGPAVPTAQASDSPPTAAPAAPVEVVPNLGPPRGQIHGSPDHALVAEALFRAAEALVERGEQLRQQDLAAAARQCDDEARDRLERAIDNLERAIHPTAPELVQLFYLGKCKEQLFRLDERHQVLDLVKDAKEYRRREQEVRDPFVKISAADFSVQNGLSVPGPWGRAAETALEHFKWMNLNAGYKPRIALESITWGPRQQ